LRVLSLASTNPRKLKHAPLKANQWLSPLWFVSLPLDCFVLLARASLACRLIVTVSCEAVFCFAVSCACSVLGG
jgi:hypothetical protein